MRSRPAREAAKSTGRKARGARCEVPGASTVPKYDPRSDHTFHTSHRTIHMVQLGKKDLILLPIEVRKMRGRKSSSAVPWNPETKEGKVGKRAALLLACHCIPSLPASNKGSASREGACAPKARELGGKSQDNPAAEKFEIVVDRNRFFTPPAARESRSNCRVSTYGSNGHRPPLLR